MATVTRGKILRSDQANWDGKVATATRVDATGGTITGLAIGNEVDVLQVFGDGLVANRSRGTLANAVQYIGSSNATLALNPGTWTIDGDLTIPSNFTLRLPAGCLVDVTTGSTLTIAGKIYADRPGDLYTGVGTVVVSDQSSHFGAWYKLTEEAAVTVSDYFQEHLRVLRYGKNTTPGTTDMSGAINDAISVAVELDGGTVDCPAGKLRCESDVEIRDHVRLRGHYNGTELEFNGCALKVDATAAANPDIDSRHIVGWGIDSLRVRRIGTAGYAVQLVTDGGSGASDNRDIARFDVRNLYIIASTGGGLSITGSYLGKFDNVFIRNCSGVGLKVDEQPETGGLATSLQGAGFFGGEIQACTKAAELDRMRGVPFYGMSIEGNDEGVEINFGTAYTFDGCYFEANSMYDFSVGTGSGSAPSCVVWRGCFFLDGAAALDYAIDLQRCSSATVEGCVFSGYGIAGVNRNGATATSVTGIVRRCEATGTTPAVVANANPSFHQDPEERILTVETVWDSGTVPAGAAGTQDFTLTGAAIGDFVEVQPSAGLSGVMPPIGQVIATDAVRVWIFNPTALDVDPSSRTFRIIVKPYNIWFS